MRPALLLLAALTSLTPAALAAEPKPKKHALLVGVKKYNHNSLSDLSYTENDVEELAALLSKPGAGFGLVRVLTTSRGGKDDTEARKWYRKAAAQGNEAAK